MKQRKNNSNAIRMSALIIGIIMNIIGNSMTIVSNEGAEPWTAAAVNASKVFKGLSVGSFIIAFGVICAIFNQLVISRKDRNKLMSYQQHRRLVIRKKKKQHKTHMSRATLKLKEYGERINHGLIDKPRFIGELVYIFIFGYLVDIVTWGLNEMHLDKLPKIPSIILSLSGVTLFCIGISLYQRANIIMHPNDDTSNLLRFVYLGGNAYLSQIADIIPALLICGLCFPVLGAVYSISWGTIYSILFNGLIVLLADKHVWPALKHNHKRKNKNKHFSILNN